MNKKLFDKLRALFGNVIANKRVIIREGSVEKLQHEAVFVFDCKICGATWNEMTKAKYSIFAQVAHCYGLVNCPTRGCPASKNWPNVYSTKLLKQEDA